MQSWAFSEMPVGFVLLPLLKGNGFRAVPAFSSSVNHPTALQGWVWDSAALVMHSQLKQRSGLTLGFHSWNDLMKEHRKRWSGRQGKRCRRWLCRPVLSLADGAR